MKILNGTRLLANIGLIPECQRQVTMAFSSESESRFYEQVAPAPDADRAHGVMTIEILGMPIRMTSPERTLVDIIHRQNSEKLIQPAWRAFEDWLPSLNLREVVLHARHSGCMATRAKVGHLLRGLSDRLNLDESLFLKLGEPPRWRHSWSRTSPEIQDPYWNLLVPEKLFLTAKESPDLAIQVNPRYDRIRDVDPSGLVDPENPALLDRLITHFSDQRYTRFRPKQEEIIRAILMGKDVLGILPTGAGKSLLYQLSSKLLNGITLVISPTVALMRDQVKEARERGLYAVAFRSRRRHSKAQNSQQVRGTVDGSESLRSLDVKLRSERIHLIYTSPESLPNLVCGLPHLKDLVRLVVVDEAHLIDTWGSTFRVAYQRLTGLRSDFPNAPILAITATATPKIETTIKKTLRFASDVIKHQIPVHRSNLNLRAIGIEIGDQLKKRRKVLFQERLEFLYQFLIEHECQAGIIYCQTREEVDEVAKILNEKFRIKGNCGIYMGSYHARLSNEEREDTQDKFMNGTLAVVVATVAFGLGVNKKDVRFVVHFGLPSSITEYTQEIGRAGRDGKYAECLLLHSMQDVGRHLGWLEKAEEGVEAIEKQLGKEATANRRAHIAERRSELNDMVALAGAGQHLHRALAEYFKDPKIESDDNWDPLESINRSIKDQPEPWNPEGLSWTSDEDEPSQEQAWKRDDCPLENLVPQDDLADQESSRHLAGNAP